MIKHAARLPLGYEVEFIWHDDTLRLAWTPDVPAIRSARAWRKFREAYNEARHEFMTMVATTTGGNVGVVDIDTPDRIGVVRPGTKH